MRPSRKAPCRVPSPESFSLRTHRFLAAGLEQQMWFWGCDAACADGNLLVRHGFTRFRPENTAGTSSRYAMDLPDAATRVELHGWCAGLYGADGGFIYVRARERIAFYDAPCPPEPGGYGLDCLHAPGRRPEPRYCRACAAFLSWVLAYEDWMTTTFGPGYRARCQERAPQPWLRPEEARGWLEKHCRHLRADGGR